MNVFYQADLENGKNYLSIDESKHCLQVLRNIKGDLIEVVDGKGKRIHARIIDIEEGKCKFETVRQSFVKQKPFYTHLAIAPTKNADRMEWMIEKLSELGIDEITFLRTKNTERKNIRLDRLEKKAVSALKQSKGSYLIKINDMIPFDAFINKPVNSKKLIAHLSENISPIQKVAEPNNRTLILIGPEGDFSAEEIDLAIKNNYQSVSIGKNTYRTETAGFIACCQINFINSF